MEILNKFISFEDIKQMHCIYAYEFPIVSNKEHMFQFGKLSDMER